METKFSKTQIKRNLEDAGCNSKQIENFMAHLKSEDINKQLLFLKCQRCTLLEDVHVVQKKIDCLDYLIYSLKKQNL